MSKQQPAAYGLIVDGAWHGAYKHQNDAKERGMETGKRFDLLPLYTSAPTIPKDYQLMDMGWLRSMMHVNALRCHPEKSHEEINAEIDKVLAASPEYKS